ncbi:MAG: putative glycolipid-binding domain-containing protein [Gemmatimonadetes bacterium]|nr:putative glycolipid-binding domain-containing protein [Gemmatimonadota bacterium]
MQTDVILWRWMDRPGHEAARVERVEAEWHLAGTCAFANEGDACGLNYRVVCDGAWRTVRARVEGWIGARTVACEITVDADGRWRLNGDEVPAVAGCVDLDLNFSPSTNLLPIRRLGLEIGEEAAVSAAWLRFPSFELERLEQAYRRTGDLSYRYESAGRAFVRELQVNAAGLVTRYPDFWEAVG